MLLFAEFTVLVLPMLFGMTIFASRPLLLSVMISIPAGLLIIMKPSLLSQSALLPTPTSHSHNSLSRPTSPSPSPSRVPSTTSLSQLYRTDADHSMSSSDGASDERARRSGLSPVPYLTTYRSHMLLMTIIAILAVDFPVFPRFLAKCESFGVSLVCARLCSAMYVCRIKLNAAELFRWTWVSDHSCSLKGSWPRCLWSGTRYICPQPSCRK